MQTTSATYDRIIAGTEYGYETRLIIDGVGTFAESDLFSVNTNIEMFQQDPEIGRAISGEVNVSMINPTVPIPTMAKIRPQVRACGTAPKSSKVTITGEDLASEYASYSNENITFNASSGATVVAETLSFAVDSSEYLESEWIAQGVYFIDTREVTQNNNGLDVLTLHGFDAMLKTEQIYSSNAAVGDDLDIAYVRAIASAIGVTVDNRTWEIMQTGYMIPFPLGYSMREILGYIASAYAGCFIISDTGQLRLVALEDIESETRYLIDEIGNIIVFGVDSPQHTVTASGAVATFTAGGEYDLDELEIAIEPVQDLHDQDAPYPAGGGKNICDSSGWTSIIDVSMISWARSIPDVLTFVNTLSAGTYTLSAKMKVDASHITSSTGQYGVVLARPAGNVDCRVTISKPATNAEVPFSGTFTITDAQVGTFTAAYLYSGASSNGDSCTLHDFQVEAGSTATAYAPYSNECPISGHTGVTVEQNNGNFFDVGSQSSDYSNPDRIVGISDGTVSIKIYASGGTLAYRLQNISAKGQFTIKGMASKTYARMFVRLRKKDDSGWMTNTDATITGWVYNAYFGGWYKDSGTIEISFTVEIPDCLYWQLGIGYANNSAVAGETETISNIMLNLGSTASPYEAYQGNTYPITFPTEAGTVYKGTLNVKTGVLTAIDICLKFGDSSLNWTYESNYTRFRTPVSAIPKTGYAARKYPHMCSCYMPIYDGRSLANTPDNSTYFGNTSDNPPIFFVKSLEYGSNVTNFLNARKDDTFVYELATPLTYQLSPQQVKTLLGQNNLWANTGNVINLEFTEPATEAVRILV